MIIGIGVDVVDLSRFTTSVERTPQLAARLFTDLERSAPPASLAAIFAAKEAIAKALGAPTGLQWHDAEIRHESSGRPYLVISGTVAEASDALGIVRWHVSLSHDAGAAIAMVIAEGDG